MNFPAAPRFDRTAGGADNRSVQIDRITCFCGWLPRG